MSFYPSQLSENHRKMLLEESGIDPEVAAERGYRTITRRDELPEAFKDYQRRAGLLIPALSPSGITGNRLRPDRSRKGKDGKLRKYEQPSETSNMIDVHPRNFKQIKDSEMDLWVTEGEKKADCLTSHGLCAIALFGVWGFCVKDTHGKELLPCWDHVALKSRRVFIVFDADVMFKENVQLALERLVAALEARGADVRIIYLPGTEKGVDDYLVAGHTVNELKMLARKFDPADIGRIRLSRDAEIRAAIDHLWQKFWDTEWSRIVGTRNRPNSTRGHSCRDAVKVAIDIATKSGKMAEDGVEFTLAMRTWALLAKTSRPTLAKVIAHMEAEGWLRRNYDGRAKDATGCYVLLVKRANLYHKGSKDREKGESEDQEKGHDPGGKDLRAPRLRWSSPGSKGRAGVVKGTIQVRQARQKTRPPTKRLGKIRGAILDALEACGGSTTLRELCEILHRARPRDLRRRNLPMLEEAGIVAIDGDVVSLTENWLDRLEEVRELGREREAEELDCERYARERKAFRDPSRDKHDAAPSEEEMRERRESAPRRRREAIACSIARLFAERPEYRSRRVGQITCQLPWYLPADFPRGPDGAPKDAEVEAILDGVAA